MASTITVQQVVRSARAYAELSPQLSTSGWSQEPALTIANDTMQRILAQTMDWKWNRAYVPSILTVALQQDYVTQVTDMGWLESGRRCDINNVTNSGNMAPKPIQPLESVRDLQQTSAQSFPFQISAIPNPLAIMGQWQALTAYSCGYGVAQIPPTPLQQFLDLNGNILYIDSTVLGLSINSPGFSGTPLVLPNSPYGISGAFPPTLPSNSAPGTTTMDGTVRWTVADPNGYAIRLSPLPAFAGLAWLILPLYQKKPPQLTSLQQTLAPIPDEAAYLFRQGFNALCYEHAGSKNASAAYAKWEEALATALRSADRERESYGFYPSEGLTSGGLGQLNIGPANPYAGC